MKLFRKVLFWCHLATGLAVGLIVLTMSVTGVLLTYEQQMTAWADTRGLDAAPPTPRAAPLSAEELVRRLEAQTGEAPASLTLRAEPDAPVAAVWGRQTRYASAYTGAVLGEAHEGVRAFFHEVTVWHRWLGAEGDGRGLGKAVTGACNLGFLFLVLSGFYLWWPRAWTRAALRNALAFRRGLSPKARDFNWHNVIGFWSLLPLFIIVLSGVVISYPWASSMVYAAFGEAPPARRGGGPSPADAPEEAAAPLEGALPLGALVGRAAERMPGWRTLSFSLPAPADTSITFALSRSAGRQPQARAQLTLDRRTGAEVRWEPFEAGTPGRRMRSVLRFAHTGEVLGLAGQTLAGLVSLGAAVLVWTGLALSWRRWRAWRKRPRRTVGAA